MKRKHLLCMLLLGGSPLIYGAVQLPEYTFFEDFHAVLPEGVYLPDGWLTYGVEEPVEQNFQPYFGSEGTGPYYRQFAIEGYQGAWSCSTFQYAQDADQWLITPPIHIATDLEMLQLKALSYGANGNNRYRVLISEGGVSQEDFRPAPLINTTLQGWASKLKTKDSYVALTGYEGKDIRLAFVNRSKDCGMLGFTDIAIAPYIIEIADNTPDIMPAGSVADITLNVTLRTPATTTGLKAELNYGGLRVTKEFDETFTTSGTRVSIVFEGIEVPQGGLDYTVTLTPAIEGAGPTVVSGEIATPTTSYPAVALIEEFTGTWCAYCPRGAAFLDYYADRYDGRDGRGKAIGIALHTSDDPMEMTDPTYSNTAFRISESKGYPSAFFNRTQQGDPSDAAIVKETVAGRSNSRITITRVDYTPGEPLQVSYEIENSYSRKDINQRVALVMIENDVRGDNAEYNQTNGLSGLTQGAVDNTYGPELWPYFKFFAESGSKIPYTQMVYNHVARGIWPDYYGTLLKDACEAEVPLKKSVTVEMPAQVDVPEHTAMIAMLLDGTTGGVLSADEVEAADYNKDMSGIATTGLSPEYTLAGGILSCFLREEALLEAFSSDGTLLLSRRLHSGANEVDLRALKGFVIIRLARRDGFLSSSRHIF